MLALPRSTRFTCLPYNHRTEHIGDTGKWTARRRALDADTSSVTATAIASRHFEGTPWRLVYAVAVLVDCCSVASDLLLVGMFQFHMRGYRRVFPCAKAACL